MVEKVRSEPIKMLVKLLKEVKMEDTYSFELPTGKGQNFLHRMRVELSRLRTKARGRGMTTKHFKIILISCEQLAGEKLGQERITIKKTRSSNDVSEEVSDLLREISVDQDKKAVGA